MPKKLRELLEDELTKQEFVITKKPIPLILEFSKFGFVLWTEERGIRHWLIDASTIAKDGKIWVAKKHPNVWNIYLQRTEYWKDWAWVFKIVKIVKKKKRGKKK